MPIGNCSISYHPTQTYTLFHQRSFNFWADGILTIHKNRMTYKARLFLRFTFRSWAYPELPDYRTAHPRLCYYDQTLLPWIRQKWCDNKDWSPYWSWSSGRASQRSDSYNYSNVTPHERIQFFDFESSMHSINEIPRNSIRRGPSLYLPLDLRAIDPKTEWLGFRRQFIVLRGVDGWRPW